MLTVVYAPEIGLAIGKLFFCRPKMPLCPAQRAPGSSREKVFQTTAAVATSFSNFRTFLSHSEREIESELAGRSRLA
jgi:hypothetical protein